jgi:hypothetical protein
MGDIKDDIKAFHSMQADLEAKNTGRWVLIHNRVLVDFYESFEKAADDAVRKFGGGPYLIRQIGAHPLTLPASVMYHFSNAQR